jgi:hypothetical protein
MRTRLQLAWRRLPILVGLALLFVPLLLWLAGQVPDWRARIVALDGPGLAGIGPPAPVAATGSTLLSGDWQRYADARFNYELPLRRPAVRATNQLYYSAFHSSYMIGSSIVRGRGGQLMEREYIADYCNFSGEVFDDARFDRWAADLQEIRKLVEARGQAFVYLITPAKPAALPEAIPSRMPCLAPEAARPRYQAALAALKRAGLPYVDGSALVHQAMVGQPVQDFFTRGGTHWTMLSAATATGPLLGAIHYRDGQGPAPLQFTWQPGGAPNAVDTDLLDLANLWRRGPPYTVPALSIAAAPAGQAPRTLAAVGGSFVNQIMDVVAATGQFRQMDYYYYFDTAHLRYPGRIHHPPSAADAYQALLQADVVLVEDNETKMPSVHVRQLLDFLRRQPAR